MTDGTDREVPPIQDRLTLIKVAHEHNGHFGVRRTVSLLRPHYYWVGMWVDVSTFVGQCESCQRARVSFVTRAPQLNSLPIVPIGVRWSVDLAGPFQAVSRQGNRYIMIAVEGYSKWVELVPLPAKEARHTADAFLRCIIGRYGAMAEVVTDRGGEWEGAFQELLEQCLVDHRRTSPSHPEANGLAERVVQSVKRCLAKMLEQEGRPVEWESYLAWIMLGYNCSVQSSTRFSPYELLFAQKPVVPPATREVCEELLNISDPKQLDAQLHARALAHRRHCVMAVSGQEIAQHRDQKRYALLRSGEYNPKSRRFAKGDYVYVSQEKAEGMQVRQPARVLRVHEVKSSGALIVEGRDGKRMRVSCTNVTPCHLLGMDGRLDTRFAHSTGEEQCQKCGSPYMEDSMLMCDSCWKGWHMECLPVKLSKVPEGLWCCPTCTEKGVTPETLQERDQLADSQDHLIRRRARQSSTAAQRAQDAKAQLWDQRLGQRMMRDGRTGELRWVTGRLHYRGGAARPLYYVLVQEDGGAERCGLQELKDWEEARAWRWHRRGAAVPRGVKLASPPPALMQV